MLPNLRSLGIVSGDGNKVGLGGLRSRDVADQDSHSPTTGRHSGHLAIRVASIRRCGTQEVVINPGIGCRTTGPMAFYRHVRSAVLSTETGTATSTEHAEWGSNFPV